jgi:hypothetical protein
MTRKYSSISIQTSIASAISNSQTTLITAIGTGSTLLGGVTLASGNVDQFSLAIDPDTVNEEIVFATAVSADTFTIVRGRAGSSAVSHSSGAAVRHVLTSNDLTYFNTELPTNLATAKGQILIASNSGVVQELSVGNNDYVLTADSGETIGVKWAPTASVNISINAQTNTTYTPVLADNSKLVTLSNSSAITFTVPANASVAYAIGTQLNIQAIASGIVTVVGDSGVTVNGTGTTLRTKWSAATCIKTATNTWTLIGDIA